MERFNNMDYSIISNKVKTYIIKEINRKKGNEDVGNNLNLIESGIIDSLGLIRLIEYLEDTFSVKIPDEEVLAENFESISAIVELITKLKKI